VVAGARPNFMKVAPVLQELHRRQAPAVLVHTGQHYDAEMFAAIFQDLGLGAPDFNLEVGSGSHAEQTARVMERFEPVLKSVRPRWVVVVGDVNSTLACALVTSKLKDELSCGIAHVEAGLRSGDWRMPEEINRVLTDRLSDLLLIPSEDARSNLGGEGITGSGVIFVGNVMIDSLLAQLPSARARGVPQRAGLTPGKYVVATIHRPSNVDTAETLRAILEGLRAIGSQMPVVLPAHPRTRRNIDAFGLADMIADIRVLPPLSYIEMLALTDSAAAMLTDSGGLQEETTVLGVPCVTLREQTERPATLTHGTNRMAPWPLTAEGIVRAFNEAVAQGRMPVGSRCPEGWDGKAALRIVDALLHHSDQVSGVVCASA
jgi:UDP-N-acetylglucosamine 2-epimerase (non-hydrolysing)